MVTKRKVGQKRITRKGRTTGRLFKATFYAPTEDELNETIEGLNEFAAGMGLEPITLLEKKPVGNRWKAKVATHNWSPLKWIREKLAERKERGVRREEEEEEELKRRQPLLEARALAAKTERKAREAKVEYEDEDEDEDDGRRRRRRYYPRRRVVKKPALARRVAAGVAGGVVGIGALLPKMAPGMRTGLRGMGAGEMIPAGRALMPGAGISPLGRMLLPGALSPPVEELKKKRKKK